MKKLIKKLQGIIKLQNLLIFVLIFFMIGMTFNFLAIKNNEGRMPVLNTNYDTKTHFGYTNFSEIEFAIFSDNYSFLGYIHSLGDIFMYFSGIAIILLAITIIFKFSKLNK